MELLIVLIIILIIFGSIATFVMMYDYENYKISLAHLPYSRQVKISYLHFLQWYYLNQNRWELNDDYATILVKKKKDEWGYYHKEYSICYFGYLDWHKYKNFKKKIENHRKEKLAINATIQILEAVQQDINNLRKQANKEIEHGAKQSIDIQKKLEEDIKLKC